MANPTLTWEKVGSRFYRVFEGYNLQWAVDLDSYNLAMAPCAGAVAVWERTDAIRPATANRPHILVYNGLGKLLVSTPWDLGSVCDAFWTLDEILVVVSHRGFFRCYHDFAGNFRQTDLESEVYAAQGCLDGFVAQTETEYVFVSLSSTDPTVKRCSLPAKGVKTWVALQPTPSSPSISVIAISTSGQQVLLIDSESVRIALDGTNKYVSVVSSVDGTLVALWTETNDLLVYTSDFYEKRFFLADLTPDTAMYWIGTQGVALCANKRQVDELNVVDIHNGATTTIYLDNPVRLFSEIDGLRMLSSSTHDLLCPVPKPVVDIFRLGSQEPSSILLNCVEQLEKGSPRANENLLVIGQNRLPSAVIECYTAAEHEIDVRWQKRLLKAAAFGKSALQLFDSADYLAAVKNVRITNALRAPEVGIYLTVKELQCLGNERILDRLKRRELYSIATAFARATDLAVEPVYVSWAIAKIQQETSKDDEQLEKDLTAKLDAVPELSYIEIAQKAFDEGRPKLAASLLNKEPRATKKVSLLLEMKEFSRALDVSVQSGDVNLVYYVILSLQRALTLVQFYRCFSDKQLAVQCYQRLIIASSTSEEAEYKTLHDFFYQMDLRLRNLDLEYKKAVTATDVGEKEKLLHNAQRGYSEIKHGQFYGKVCGTFAQLTHVQRQLEGEYETTFVGMSLADTVSRLLQMSQVTRAQKIKTTFKMSDAQFWWLRLRALVERRDWDGLDDFSRSAKSPIGYEPFFELAKEAGNNKAAESFVSLCTTSPLADRVRMFLEVGAKQKALDLALKSKDEDLLAEIRATARTTSAT